MRMAVPTHRPVLTYSNSEGAHSFPLNKHAITIGRHADQDLVLPDTFVSRRHAILRETSAGYEIEDLDSSHGTWLNGARIQSSPIRSGDILQFGSPGATKVRFHSFASDTEPFHLAIASDLLTTLGQISTRERTPAQEMGQLNFLLNAARKLNAGSATKDILHALLQLSIQLTSVERGFAFLLDPDSTTGHASLHLALGLSSSGEFLSEDSTLSRTAIQQA